MAGTFTKRPMPDTYKQINIGFILLNKDSLTIKQMAEQLNVSAGKIRSTMKEFKIDYKKKDTFFTKYKKKEDIKHF